MERMSQNKTGKNFREKSFKGEKAFQAGKAFKGEKSFKGERSYKGEKAYSAGKSFKGEKSFGEKNALRGSRDFSKTKWAGKPVQEQKPEREKDELLVEGRNNVLSCIEAEKTIDRIFIQEGLHDSTLQKILALAREKKIQLRFEEKEKMDYLSQTKNHQGVICRLAAEEYCEVEDILNLAREKGEDPFIFVLDGIEDPHNLGAIIRTAEQCGSHGVIIRENRAVGLTSTVSKTSAGAIHFIKVAKVVNIAKTVEELKKQGIWFVCADMDGEPMYQLNLTGPLGIVIGNEGEGVSRLVKEKCDFCASIPMYGRIDSLNASVAAGVLAYEVIRQKHFSVDK